MKKLLLIIALLALVVSPFMVPQVEAATTRHHRLTTRHHRKQLRKHSVKRLGRRYRGKAAA